MGFRRGILALAFCLYPAASFGADRNLGIIRGNVTLEATGDPLHTATVVVVQLRRSAQSGDDGAFVIPGVPPGRYELVAHLHAFTDDRKTVEVKAGETATVNFSLRLAPVRHQITVTASGQEETTLEAFQSVTTIESLELTQRPATSLGDLLEQEPGVAKRSSGPGTTRPVVRGFDGDRVLILQDGIRSGTISSQSGDHGVPVDSSAVDQIEVVRGPATLLYGSNAIGGVVNMITSHHQIHHHPHEGVRGYLTGSAGTADRRGGGAGGFEIGRKHWLFWADGGGQRSADYSSPLGRVHNSGADIRHLSLGSGHYGEKIYFSGFYGVYDGQYGIPNVHAEVHGHADDAAHDEDHGDVSIKYRRQAARFNLGVKNLGAYFEQFQLTLSYTDWNHKERGAEPDTGRLHIHNEFFNKQFVYRGVLDQKRRGRWIGNLGFSGMRRDYKSVGEEAITPPTVQNAFAVFALEQAQFERFRLQFGGRLETNAYRPTGLKERTFTGFSGAAGINAPLWRGGAFVANYTTSYRAPALEELYAFGPHAGNLTWEIGDPNLKRERGNGVDLSLRHQSARFHGDANFFYYDLADYVYLAPTGHVHEGLFEGRYASGAGRYWGVETHAVWNVSRPLWLKLNLDSVTAELKSPNTPLPRIPPLRARFGVEYRRGGFSAQPELLLVNRQDRVFPTERETAGYATLGGRASYTIVRQHALQMFSVNLYNATNRLYRNHLSFIKEFAPEIGRGVLFSYTIRFF